MISPKLLGSVEILLLRANFRSSFFLHSFGLSLVVVVFFSPEIISGVSLFVPGMVLGCRVLKVHKTQPMPSSSQLLR